ncbi:3-oxo-tetronate kinase [Salinivibrio kushneri]|uniref:3-oxo-tetronate kinase n=1 Tax=Salinivibrio kushneri TaxID=1908198 RepID=UPI000C830CC9|nr:3-oxo-tetronate kinase [Salinivibrio kushneri]
MRIGVIADDFTGGTDIASLLVKGGLKTVQLSGVPQEHISIDADAIVVSLKSRSCDIDEAVQQSISALRFLQQAGCVQFYFKYCSTFDSTAHGNIGPVTDALMQALTTPFTVVCPSLPINGRCVFNGNLYVNGVLLSESGMRHHPVTPMRDSNLVRLMNAQAKGETALLNYEIVEQGPEKITEALQAARQNHYKYAVVDAFKDFHLANIAASLGQLPLVTGGSGLAHHIACSLSSRASCQPNPSTQVPKAAPTVILSGSCSEMTNLQVHQYQEHAPSFQIEVERCLGDEQYAEVIADWVLKQKSQFAPLVYATSDSQKLKEIQRSYNAESAGSAIEALFAKLTRLLSAQGITNFIVAGGETSGIVTQQLQLQALKVGKEIAPGVPWVFSLDGHFALALKSGNFGSPHFFKNAQEMFHDE